MHDQFPAAPSAVRPRHPFLTAQADILHGMRAWRMWMGLGLQDIRIRYKRTILGPLWITVSMSATFVCIGMLFSAVYRTDVHTYLPYLAAGMVVWNFIGAVASDAPRIFLDAHHVIDALRIPLVVHVLRCIVRNGIILAHNLAAAMAAFLILGGVPNGNLVFLPIGLALLFATALFASIILAVVGARFRDLGPIIGIVVQLMFFMTPIMWRLEDLPDASKWWVTANPAYHLLETVRAPLLGGQPSDLSLVVAAATTLGLGLAAHVVYCGFRRRIPYWL